MMKPNQAKRAVTAILFSLIMAGLLGLGGRLVGMYLWAHFGRLSKDPDDSDVYLCGLAVGGLMALIAGTISLWKFWPRNAAKAPQSL
jgi:hypothetical protein